MGRLNTPSKVILLERKPCSRGIHAISGNKKIVSSLKKIPSEQAHQSG